MRRDDQQKILAAVQTRVVQATLNNSVASRRPIDEVLAESVFHYRQGLKESPRRRPPRKQQLFWDTLKSRVHRVGEAELAQLLADVVLHYAHEVCGNFNALVYSLARHALPPVLGALLNASSPKRLMTRWLELAPLEAAVILQGETEHLRRLHEVGTVIIAPNHVSNLDSVLLAFSLNQLNLPPFVYGAARDLFANPLLGFFLRNLGAYSIDRRNQDPLYKHVLKEYATLTLEHGYDNLFFPGGVRSRSGAMERHLKLGLIGTAIPAYVRNLQRSAPRPKLFVVPATLSYQLVLEAETLVDDFLKEAGKSRYIITDDEFSQPHRIYDFITQLFGLDSKIYVTIGRGFDPFGNPVDDSGESCDPHGRRIDCSRYVLENNQDFVAIPARDVEYTRDLGQSLVGAYRRDNTIQTTHVTARVVLSLLRRANPQLDLLRLIRVGGRDESLALQHVYSETRRLLADLRVLAERRILRLSDALLVDHPEDVVSDGLRHFQIYHRRPAAERRGDRIIARERSLLFYYQSRLEGYGLEEALNLAPALTPDHRFLGAV